MPGLSDQTPEMVQEARRERQRTRVHRIPECDIRAEIRERTNNIALALTDLDMGEPLPEPEAQLRGGIAWEQQHIAALYAELARREQAAQHGYTPPDIPPRHDLARRFAAVRDFDCAVVMTMMTGQARHPSSGGRRRFHCPLHEDRTPSLVTYPDGRGWYCFSCNAGGDAVRLVSEIANISLIDALVMLESGAVGAGTPQMVYEQFAELRREVDEEIRQERAAAAATGAGQ